VEVGGKLKRKESEKMENEMNLCDVYMGMWEFKRKVKKVLEEKREGKYYKVVLSRLGLSGEFCVKVWNKGSDRMCEIVGLSEDRILIEWEEVNKLWGEVN
jgi:hypothetical protein